MRNKIKIYLIGIVIIFFALKLLAQEKSKFGTTIKAQYVPQIGIYYGISDKIQMRLSTYLDIDGGDFFSSNLSSLCLLFELSSDAPLSTYIGPDLTFNGFSEEFRIGLILGKQYDIHPRLSLFAEFGPSLRIGDGIEAFSFLNTGVGVRYYFK